MPDSRWSFPPEVVDAVLDHYSDLSSGQGIDINVECYGNSPSYNSHASFEEFSSLAAELARRIKKCGLDGILTERRYGIPNMKPQSCDQLADERCMDAEEIRKAIESVKGYITGSVPRWIDTDKRKGMTYEQYNKLNIMREKYNKYFTGSK